ncbi:hypothetical protein, partial [Streptomyces sp. sk2.1]|uniref:hypothetical protein n=1 Tax=Streptomyces sp. sk2.1 TaxID=2478959 RepID=UPI0021CCAB3E
MPRPVLRCDRGLVRDGGQLCRRLGSESPWDVVQNNLALVATALEHARIPYFVTRDTNVRHAVAVHTSNREAVLRALTAAH